MPIAPMLREGVAGPGPSGTRFASPAAVSRSRAHVCFVAPYAWPVLSRDPDIQVVGGAEVQQCILARLLARAGYRVSMITFDYGQQSPVEVDGVTVHKAFRPEAGLPVVRFLHPRLTTMWRVMREVDADVYYQRSSAVWTGVMQEFCRRHGKRSIYAGASDRDFVRGKEQIKLARDRWIYRRGVQRVDRVVAQNAFQVKTCREYAGREAVFIPSCYELPQSSKSKDADRVLWVGTVHDYKRPEILLDIAQRLPQRKFVMIGGPSAGGERFRPGYFEGIRERAKRLANVEFTGFLPLAQVEPWFDRARALVLTSVYEGMPNVFLQAWARGVPVVSTVDVGVAAPANTVIADAAQAAVEVERLFSEPARWARASDAARSYFQSTHSPEHVLALYGALIEELVA